MANWWDSAPIANSMDLALHAEGASPQVAELARSVYMQESSGGRNTQTSNAGAVGGMQIIPATFNSVADKGWDIKDPIQNARAGVRYLNQMYEKGGNDPRMAAIGYYGGPGAITAAQNGKARSDPRNPNAPDTFQYADQVVARTTPQPAGNWWDAAPVVEQGQPAPPGVASVNIAHAAGPTELPQQPSGAQGNAAAGGFMGGVLQGMRDPIDAGAQMLRRAVPGFVGNAVDQAGNYLADLGLPVARSEGVQGVDNIVNQSNAQYDADRTAAGREGFDAARLGGNVATVLPMMMSTGGAAPATLMGRMLLGAGQGAAAGALAPVVGQQAQQTYSDELLGNAALGATFGAAGPAVMGGLARVASPNASRGVTTAQMLRNEGVQLTPGQVAGGGLMRFEDKLMSAPILGDAIRGARGRANEQLNRAVYNRVLKPIGQNTSKVGRAGVDEVSKKVSQAYDDVLQHVKFSADDAFVDQLEKLSFMADDLPAKEAQQFQRILDREVLTPLLKGKSIDGQSFKTIETQLGQRAQSFLKSTDSYQKDLGHAIGEVQTALRENLVRLNPAVADRLRAVNDSFANLVRLQKASGAVGAADGVFTPAQLAQAVRGADGTVRHNGYARGNALMQDLSDAARERMSSVIPNSGTADRLATFGIGGTAMGLLTGAVSPVPVIAGAAGIGAAALPYMSPMIGRAVNNALSVRPASAQQLANQLRRLPPGAFGILAQ